MFLRSTPICRAFRSVVAAAAVAPLLIAFGVERTIAQELPPLSLLSPGDAVVTGFSGILPPDPPPPAPTDPIDETFINPDGASMQIQRLQPSGPPAGQLIPSPTIFAAKARDVGQVFPITFDDALAPNIYLGATSAFGLQIVVPDSDGDGRPERVKTGQPGATFMDGQWGPGGTAGSIWKVDGTSGAISLFTTIGANSGPGLGDVVFDRTSHQFFVSDLDTGLIYRLDSTGLVTDTFDHGLSGRPHLGLPPVADDGSSMSVTDAAFNSEDPATWGYTQKERMVWGMAMHGGRLYYTVKDPLQVWSVGINLDGSFADDARWELDVTGLASTDPISDMTFDGQGRMILAQRGVQRGSYDYTVFAEPKTASVVRYTREVPDDPATPGTWVPVAEEYAIGFRPDGHNSNGGVSLGYGYDANGYLRPNSCGEFLWSTGEALRDNPALAAQLAAGGPATVDGLQGNDKNLVRPANDPPFSSYFTDYDGNYDHPEYQGWMGDVEVFQSCGGGYGYIPPYYPPPGYTPPPSGTFNLTLDKEADPKQCFAGGLGWVCYYTIRVTNTGSAPYWGPISVHDWLPGLPPGAVTTFDFQPPWTCSALGPWDYQCDYPPVFLYPGEGVDLYVTVDLPAADDLCYLDNAAQIYWPYGYGDADPSDDIDFASAYIPNEKCKPFGEKTNLKIEKKPIYDICLTNGTVWGCAFDITVTNTGPGVYNGPIQITDTLSVPDAIVYGPKPNPPDWTCVPPAGGAYTCDHAPVVLNPGQSVHLFMGVVVPVADQEKNGKCTVENKAHITFAPGGSNQNTDPTDDDAYAEAKTPGKNCEPIGGKKTDLSIRKRAEHCIAGNYLGQPVIGCVFTIAVKNEGPNDFFAPITLHDVYTPAVTAIFGPASWGCGPAGGGYDCTYNPPAAIPMGGVVLLHTAAIIPVNSDICKIDNAVQITAPPGGSDQNTNPANDSSAASIMVPSPQCQPPSEKHSNFKIQKRAGDCRVGDTQVTCRFAIGVSNTGPDDFTGVVGFLDATESFGVPTMTPSASPPWVCAAAAPLSGCVMNGPFPSGTTATFHVDVQAPLDKVRDNGCRIRNVAALKLPPVGQWNTIAADDVTAIITATIPAELCRPQAVPTNLKIEKVSNGDCTPGEDQGGFNCGYAVTVTNTGPSQSQGPITVQDQIPAGLGFGYSGAGVTCSGGGTTWSCVYANNLAPGASFSFNVDLIVPPGYGSPGTAVPPDACHVTNRVTIMSPLGLPNNALPADDTAQATSFVPSQNCVSPAVVCPALQKTPTGGCCPDGQIWTGRVCGPAKTPTCPAGTTGTPPDCTPIVKACPPGSVGTFPNCRCPAGTFGTPPNCKPVVKTCPPGSVGTPPNCRCPAGTFGTPPECKPIVKACPPGSVGTPPNCRCPAGTFGTPPNCKKIEQVCPKGSVGVPPNCRCPTGMIGTPPNCRPVVKTCPPGSVGTPPNCRCPPGTVGTPPVCEKIVQVCPKGSVGTPPNCRCPTGMIGTPPNCRPAVKACPPDSIGPGLPNCRCKPGTQGDPGHCTPIVKKCPTGTIGIPPNCKEIVIKPRVCPQGSVGTPPNCRCPSGTVGQPPNCQQVPR